MNPERPLNPVIPLIPGLPGAPDQRLQSRQFLQNGKKKNVKKHQLSFCNFSIQVLKENQTTDPGSDGALLH